MHFLPLFLATIWCSSSPSAATAASNLIAPALYLDPSPSPYSNRPPPQDENGEPVPENDTLIALGRNSEYKFPQGTYTGTLICNATYPIKWIFHNTAQNGHASWMISLRMRRDVKIIYDTSTYSYTAELGLFGDYNRITGNYSCVSTTKEELRNSVYVFWEGGSPPFLLQASENRTACIKNGVAILPCQVSKPTERAVLWKATDKGYLHLRQNGSIWYDPTIGFTMLERDLPTLAGDYMCTPSSDGEPIGQGVTVANPAGDNLDDGSLYRPKDFVNVTVKQCEFSMFMIDPNKSNATFKYDAAKGDLVCCSSSGRVPKIFHVYCHHPVICAFRQEMDAYFLKMYQAYGTRIGRRKSGCTRYKVFVHSPGVARCVGDGIDRSIEYSFPILGDYTWGMNVSHIPIYFNWNEIQPTEMMVIQSTPIIYRSGHRRRGRGQTPPSTENATEVDPIYEGEWIHLFCHTSLYYFAEGIHWAIKYKNNTQSFVASEPKSDMNEHRGRYGSYGSGSQFPLYIQAHQDMESVICIAPVWNSTEYVHKAFHLYVNQSVPPVLIDPEHEQFTWVMNDTNKKITCEATGVPIPEIYWEWHKAGEGQTWKVMELTNSSYTDEMDNTTHIISETVTIPRVSYTDAGFYNCVVTNYGGTVYKIIEITVEEPPSWKTMTVVVVGVILVTLLVAGLVLLIWRLRIEKRTVQNLAAMSYQDGITRRISEVNPNYEDAYGGGGDEDGAAATKASIQHAVIARAIEAKLHAHGNNHDESGHDQADPWSPSSINGNINSTEGQCDTSNILD